MRRLLEEILEIIGLASLLYLLFVGVHELMHVKNAHDYGIEVSEVCILGYDFENNTFAWTKVYSSYQTPRDKEWDYLWYEWLERR